MIIRKAYPYRMHTGETQTFGSRVLKCIETFDLAGLMLLVLFNKLKDSVETLTQVLVKYQAIDKTKALKASDEVRDDAFVSFRKSLASIALRRDKKKAALANKLLDIIRQHGWDIHAMNYAEESSHLTNLIKTIKGSPELMSAVTELGLTDHLEEIVVAQMEFEAILLDRDQSEANQLEINGSNASKVVKADCIKLFQAIDSLYTISQKPEYLQMANLINEVVDAQAQVIRARITRSIEKEENTKMP